MEITLGGAKRPELARFSRGDLPLELTGKGSAGRGGLAASPEPDKTPFRHTPTLPEPFRPKIEIEVDVQLLQQPHQGQRVHQRGDWFLPGISEIREKWMEESQPEHQQQKRHHVSREPDADKRNIREISTDWADHVMIAIGRVAGV